MVQGTYMRSRQKLLAVFMATLILFSGWPAEVKVYAETVKVPAVSEEADIGSVVTAGTQVFKYMDYSFLKEYRFGGTHGDLASVSFGSVRELGKSCDVRLRKGTVIRTEGYYGSGDGGNAVYMILSEEEMQEQKAAHGAVALQNGLYACILPDIYEADGKAWVVVSAKQFGAAGDGKMASQDGIGAAAAFVSEYAAAHEEIFRGLVYIPAGEYKCTNEVHMNDEADINVVGDGDATVLFTDNDYRAAQGYAEFFFQSNSSRNMYFGDFRIEAREVDLYHYMRQFVLVYCDNVCLYRVNLVIPQETCSGYYFEDKQYSNFCCYSGDTNITVDTCTMVLLSGTYRGANIGIMDFWNRPVENITIVNCDLTSNARDEQIGIFNVPKTGTQVNENTSITNVDIVRNTIRTLPVKYPEVVGHQNMCFTVAYTDSVRIDDVRFAGNHFICRADSKFVTFGNLTNCVVEDNIIEIITTQTSGAAVFDSGNADAGNVLIRNNEFFLTSEGGGQVKAGLIQGKMTFQGNRVFSDTGTYFGALGQFASDNELVFPGEIGSVCG